MHVSIPSQNRSILLRYFFREYFELNQIPKNKQWNATYKPSTGYTALRGHLERHHEEEYLKACQENGWKVMLPTWLKKEKATLNATLQEVQSNRVPFTQEEFLQHLVNWIVADDQVRIHLITLLYLIYISYFTVFESCRSARVPSSLGAPSGRIR